MDQDKAQPPQSLSWHLCPKRLRPSVLGLRLEAGDFLELSFEGCHRDLRLQLEVVSPQGRPLLQSRWTTEPDTAKRVQVFSEESGDFRFELRSLGKLREAQEVTAGLRSKAGPVSARDLNRIAAAWAYDAAEIAFEEGNLAIASGGFEIARDHLEAADDPRGLAKTWLFLGQIRSAREDWRGALEAWRQALSQAEVSRDALLQGRLLERIGDAQASSQNLAEALDSYRSASRLFDRCRHLPGQVSARHGSARALRHLGYPEEALEAFEGCLELLAKIDRPEDEVSVRIGMGRLFLSVNQPRAAEAAFLRGKASAESQGDKHGEALSLKYLGDALRQSGELEQARVAFEKAHRSFQSRGHDVWQAKALTSLGCLYLEKEHLTTAARHLEEALAFLRESAPSAARALAHTYLARCELARGSLEEASNHFNHAQTLYRRAGSPSGLAAALQGEGLAQYYRGRLDRALECSEAALETFRDLSRTRPGVRQVNPEDVPASAYWRLRVDCLMGLHEQKPQAGRHTEAAKICEQWRTFRLEHLLGGIRAHPRNASPESAVQETQEAEVSYPARSQEIAEGGRRRLGSRTSASTARPSSEEPPPLQPPGLPRLASSALPLNLAPGTQRLSFFLGETRSYLWLDSGSGMETFTLPPRSEIDIAAQTFIDLVQTPSRAPVAAVRRAGEELAALLFGEASSHLVGPRLLIVPDGSLSYIPFAALPTLPPNDGTGLRYFVEDFEIILQPTPSALSRGGLEPTRLGVPGRLPTAIIDSPSKNTLRPASTPFDGGASVISAAKPHLWAEMDLRGYSWVHWVPRFRSHRIQPELFSLSFGQNPEPESDPLLCRLQDIYSLDLRADLASIALELHSLDDETQETGLSALFQSFFFAGCRRLLVQLWNPVHDATGELWRRFRRNLLRDEDSHRMPYGRALRQAQISMLREEKWAHPRHWSGAQLHGDW